MKHKYEVFNRFKECKAEVKSQKGRKVKYLRSDNGGEYRYHKFLQLCKDEDITRHSTIPKTPRQDGVVECINGTLLERPSSMRLHPNLPKSFWAEVVNHAYVVVNRSPSVALDCRVREDV